MTKYYQCKVELIKFHVNIIYKSLIFFHLFLQIDPNSRPSAQDLVGQLQKIFDAERRRGKKTLLFPNQPTSPIVNEKIILKKGTLNQR